MFAGLSEAIGECVVVIDCDLQHPQGENCGDVSSVAGRL